MKRRYNLRAFTYRRCDALNRAGAHITYGKYACPACLQGRPVVTGVGARQYKSLAVQCDVGSREPIRIGLCPDEQE